jgi:hypothetical protein
LKWLAAHVSSVAAIAKDGTRIYFESSSKLTGTANANGETAAAGTPTYTWSNRRKHLKATLGLAFVAREPSLTHEEDGERTQGGFDTTATGNYCCSRAHTNSRARHLLCDSRSVAGWRKQQSDQLV